MAICLSGDFNPEETIAIIKKYFSDWKANPELPEWVAPEAKALTEPATAEVWSTDAEEILMGWRYPGYASKESDIAEIAGVRMRAIERPPSTDDVRIRQAGVIIADVSCVKMLQGFLKNG